MSQSRERALLRRASGAVACTAAETSSAGSANQRFGGHDRWSQEARLALALAAERGISLDADELLWDDVRDLQALQHYLAQVRPGRGRAA